MLCLCDQVSRGSGLALVLCGSQTNKFIQKADMCILSFDACIFFKSLCLMYNENICGLLLIVLAYKRCVYNKCLIILLRRFSSGFPGYMQKTDLRYLLNFL